MSVAAAAFLERLTAASGDYNKAKVGTLSALDAVYLDIKSEAARMGQTIRVYYPDVSAFTDQGANDWNPDPLNPGFVDVSLGKRPGKAITISDFEQFQTETSIIEQFFDPMYKRAAEYANQDVFNQITAANFPTSVSNPLGASAPGYYASYAPIATAPSVLDVNSARLAWNLLKRNKVPVARDGLSKILYHTDIHGNTLNDPAWNQENIVGAINARAARQDASVPGSESNTAFQFTRHDDQQAPTSTSSTLSGTVTVANGSTTVTGSSTHFTTQVVPAPTTTSITQVPPIAWVNFVGDAAGTPPYPMSVTSDTAGTLLQAYTGSQTSGVSITKVSYTSIAMHKYAIALVLRPLDSDTGPAVMTRIIKLKGIPIRISLSYIHLKSAWMLTFDYGMVSKVIRPDFGVLLNS